MEILFSFNANVMQTAIKYDIKSSVRDSWMTKKLFKKIKQNLKSVWTLPCESQFWWFINLQGADLKPS